MQASRADHRTAVIGRLTGWLAVLPFLLFSFVLPGNMLARDATGGVIVVLCSDGRAVEMVMTADGNVQPASKSGHDSRHACDWAPHGQPLAQGGDLAVPPVVLALRWLAPGSDLPAHLYLAEILAASARGPPAIG